METTRIRTAALDAVIDRVRSLNKRAERLGLPAMGVVEVDRVAEIEKDEFGWDIEVLYSDVAVIGSSPVLAGWTLRARLEHLGDANVINSVPGTDDEPLPEHYRHVGPDCDHCRMDRRRRDTFVVRHEDGSYKQVGRTCIKDFLGHANPLGVASWFESVQDLVDSLENDSFDVPASPAQYPVPAFAALAAAVIRTNGFISKRRAEEEMTASTADIMGAVLRGDIEDIKITDADQKMAADTAEWVENLEGRNDYEHNLKVIFSQSSTNLAHAGFVAAAVNGCRSSKAQAAQAEAATEVPEGRQSVEGEIVKTDVKINEYGERQVMQVRDDRGFVVWGTVPASLRRSGVEVGDRVRFDAALSASDRKGFGFFNRPSKAAKV